MERIKLAIEKAKASSVPVPTGTRPAMSRHPIDHEVHGSSPVNTASLADIQYVQTAVVSLDLAHLEQNRIIAMHKDHQASWAFDVLRTQVLQKMDENGWLRSTKRRRAASSVIRST
jgi:protein-tyrosine kinase